MKRMHLLLFLFTALGGSFLPSCNQAGEDVRTAATSASDAEPDSLVTLPIDTSSAPSEDSIRVERVDGYYQIDWKFLARIDFEERFNEEVEDYIFYPLFHPSVQNLEDEAVEIKGYVIPFEETGQEDLLILSAFPYSNCFFCGNAGPESVMDIQLKAPLRRRLEQDDMVTFRGKLHLNDTDLYYLNYMLLEAELVD